MSFSVQFYILLCLVGIANSVSNPKIAGDSFCYDEDNPKKCGPSNWGGLCNTGTEQSPVDIQVNNTFGSISSQRKTAFSLSHEYFNKFSHFYVMNDGQSLMIQLDSKEETSNLILRGANMKSPYVFAQLHFHWGQRNAYGSEHTIDGRRYPMEVHLVHYKSIYGSLSNAMEQNDREAIAVLAVFFEISGILNTDLIPVFEAAAEPELRNPGRLMKFNAPISISSFFPQNMDFVRYLGSLTTPNCDENVIWTVFPDPILISELQMDVFRWLRTKEGRPYDNFRPIQPINGRQMTFFKSQGIRSSSRVMTISPVISHLKSTTQVFFHLISDPFIKGIITPTFIFTVVTKILFWLFNITIPVVVFK